MLIRCIAQHCGFSGNRPVAACIIFKCLLNWRSFEVERTSVFDRIIQTIGHAIEVGDSKTIQVEIIRCDFCALHLNICFQITLSFCHRNHD